MCLRVCVCGPPIITTAWEDCFGTLAVVSACECSHLLIEGPDYRRCASGKRFCLPKPKSGIFQPGLRTFPPPPPSLVAVSGCVRGELGGVPIHTPSHRWISVRVISGFGGLIQIPLFVNTANIP